LLISSNHLLEVDSTLEKRNQDCIAACSAGEFLNCVGEGREGALGEDWLKSLVFLIAHLDLPVNPPQRLLNLTGGGRIDA